MADGIVLDQFGHAIRRGEKPPKDNQAVVGRVRDQWAGKTSGEITPELAARVIRGDADLSQQMAVAKRLLVDPHIATCMQNLVYPVSRMAWEILPFDTKSAAAKKDADQMRAFFGGLKFLRKLERYLMYGEHYPFVGAGLPWNRDYGLDNFIRINPVRWKWDDPTNTPRLLTESAPTKGVTIEGERRGYIIYMAELEPGGPRESGKWRKALWLWMFTSWTWAAWVRFAEAFGNPYIWAFFSRPEEKASVLEAVLAMDANARGVFPAGTEIKLQEAQRYGTTALYQAIIEQAREGLTKLYLGHQLNTEVESGSGTLAGGAAQQVTQANLEGVADNLEETIQQDLATPWCEWHLGTPAVERGEIPRFQVKSAPAEDLERKSTVYVSVNEALAAVGRAIDPEQIEEEFAVRTVERAAAAAPADQDPDGNTPPAEKKQAKARAAAAKKPKIATLDDAGTAARRLVQKACEDFGDRIAEIFESAESIDDAVDALWEGYGEMDVTRLASGVRDVTVTANLIGRGDAKE